MNLHRGFIRLTLVASIIAAFAVATLWRRPTLDEFRWRAQTAEEKLKAGKAEAWFSNHPNEFDPDMFLALGVRGQALKDHQRLVPYEYAMAYYVFPFLGAAVAVWISYGVVNYLIRGFKSL